MVDIADMTAIHRASDADATDRRAPAPTAPNTLLPLTMADVAEWRALADCAIEPNGYYLPDWELAVNATVPGRTGASALIARDDASRLIGLMPMVALRRATKIPLPALASAHPYGTLCTPLLDPHQAVEAATLLMQAARDAGARALLLRDMSLDGAAMQVFMQVLRRDGIQPRVISSYSRACLDATSDAEKLLHDALGAKKLKELRRQRHRLAEHGAISFDVARSPDEVANAIEAFLELEASGWKGQRGTALMQVEGDATFIRRATVALAETGRCEIIILRAGDLPVAAGIVLRQQSRAFFFKIGIDERFAKFSPGVQLTLELTRHLCADPTVASADSTASADHPMINPIWRGRLTIGDVLMPLRKDDPIAALIHATLAARQSMRDVARRAVHTLRAWRKR